MAKMQADSKTQAKLPRKVRHVRIERAKNGVSVTHRLEDPALQHGQVMQPYEPEKAPMLFSGKGARGKMLSHVGELYDNMGVEGEGAEQA